MIKRYQTEELIKVLSQEYKFQVWLNVERTVAEVEEAAGIIPKGLSGKLRRVKVKPERIEANEKITNHDVEHGIGQDGLHLQLLTHLDAMILRRHGEHHRGLVREIEVVGSVISDLDSIHLRATIPISECRFAAICG